MHMNVLKITPILFTLVFSLQLLLPSSIQAQWEILGERNFLEGETFPDGFHFSFSNGKPYIVYSDRSDDFSLNVIAFDGNEWLEVGPESIPSGEVRSPTMAFDGDDIYIAYSDKNVDFKTSVITYDGTSWSYVGVRGFSEDEARFQSIAIKDSEVYVAFEDKAHSFESSVMKFDGTDWDYVGSPGFTVEVSEGQSVYNEISFNEGELYMIFNSPGSSLAANTYVMKYREENNNWIQLGNEGFPNAGVARQSLDFINGNPHFAYLDFNNFGISAKRFVNDEWINLGIDNFSGDIGNGPEIHVVDNIPYVAYDDFSVDQKLTVMYFDGLNWLPLENLGVSPGTATRPEIISDGSKLYVAFLDDVEFASGNLTVMTYQLMTDVNDINRVKEDFEILPNPAKDHITISLEEEIQSISILTLEGKLIRKYSQRDILLEGLSSGIYLIQVQTEKGIRTQRFVKK